MSLADQRPSANDLLYCPFLNDLESETANNAVRLKVKEKSKGGKIDTKSQYTINPSNKCQADTQAESNTTTTPQNIEPKLNKEETLSMTKKIK